MEFEKVVDLYYPSLYRFALSLARQESEAADLVQQTFYIWAEKGSQLKDRSKAKSWLFTTLHREFLGKHARIVKFPQLEFEEASEELPQVESVGRERADAGVVLDALERLDPAFRGAVALFYLEDYSYPEISEILQVPLGTVKSRISRGVVQLQRLLVEPGLREGRIGR